MVMVLAPLRGKAESSPVSQGAGGRKVARRIDTTKAKPVTNSLADAMPAELRHRLPPSREPGRHF